ncbi:unnamed protein product [Protopolystoma xenopodis]|uniref:Uncharacterized protein n=1 Tax=Protopolystoma xenopodis TaxID=117903 RepID=A0A448XA59_9PLAT|nr:unnamed protein product [Protopolystoma xenopodis]
MFYTNSHRCKRYGCAVCGGINPANNRPVVRVTEWVTGTTLADALFHANETYVIDDFTERRCRALRQAYGSR